jgi:hypothetical protein
MWMSPSLLLAKAIRPCTFSLQALKANSHVAKTKSMDTICGFDESWYVID